MTFELYPALERRIAERLAAIERAGLRRTLTPPSGVDLSSNDYLGLARDPRVVDRMIAAAHREGCGATASRLLRGHREAFADLERRFARFKKTDASLYFGSGYLANIGVLATFLEQGDVVFSDTLNHASLIDGMRLSKARCVLFDHCNVDRLTRLLAAEHGPGLKFVVTESLFSMDGDRAPLADYAVLCRQSGAALIVDEAHAVGVYGPGGSGLIEEAGIDGSVFLSINTAGKALGVAGAFVAGSAWAIDYLIQRARTIIYSTAAPPSLADALDAALTIVQNEPGRRTHLMALASTLREQLSRQGLTPAKGGHIIPIVLGDPGRTSAAAEALAASGFDVRAIRPPTVPAGTSRLRVSINARLDCDTLDRFAATLERVLQRIDRSGIAPRSADASTPILVDVRGSHGS
ncbi:MAG: aminotransferase class I/II-fold pyridoxal phosphate-dependent enzyme [Vicinamibacterales bacterium]